LSNLSEINEKAEDIISIYGSVDILINSAEVGHTGNVLQTEIAVDQQIMAANYFGPLALTKRKQNISTSKTYLLLMKKKTEFVFHLYLVIAPSMVEKKSGRVVFISSVQGKIAIPFRYII